MSDSDFYYWDVFPKSIKQSSRWREVEIQISIRGNPVGEIEFESVDDDIAWVDNDGCVHCGWQPGNTMILVYDSSESGSVRYIQVEVTEPPWEQPS